jgi:hypothetical protein
MAYLYVVDEFLQTAKYAKELMRAENRLTDLGLGGRFCRLSPLRQPGELLGEEIRHGNATVVAVGNDATVGKILDAVIAGGATLGLLPWGQPSELAHELGYPPEIAACDILSARNIETVDLGQINGRYFIRQIRVENFSGALNGDGHYKITPRRAGTLQIRNLGGGKSAQRSDPRDGWLEAEISVETKTRWWPWRSGAVRASQLRLQRATVEAERPQTILVDGWPLSGTKFNLQVCPQKLKVIIGKSRQF